MGIKSDMKWAFFKAQPIVLKPKYQRWKEVAQLQKVSRGALKRLEWIIYYETKGDFNATITARYFGIARKTLYKYLNRFDSTNFHSLEEYSRAPMHVRQREITTIEESRIKSLRQIHIFWGKEKLKQEYIHIYGEDISCHKILYTIQKYKLYPNLTKIERSKRKRKAIRHKKKITDLKQRNMHTLGWLIQIDTVVLHLFGFKRYIITAIDRFGKLAFARAYKNKSSYCAADFLKRLNYLLDNQITNIQTDHGSEFVKYFEKACSELEIDHYFSRVRTPQDNAVVERFNRTLQEEWLSTGQFNPNIDIFNARLTDWLVYYNFKRRHASCGNICPMDFCVQTGRVLPMSSTDTGG